MRVLWGLMLAGVLALAMEATARTEDWVAHRTPLLSPFRSQVDLMVRDSLGFHGRPDSRYRKWVMNSLGTRGPEPDPPLHSGAPTVVATGASETFGLYESPGKEYARVLEAELRFRADSSCPELAGVNVLNAALPGMSLPTVIQDIELRISQWNPRVITYYPTPTQYLVDAGLRPARPDSTGRAAVIPTSWYWYPRSLDRVRTEVKALIPAWMLDSWRRTWIASAGSEAQEGLIEALPGDRVAAFGDDLRELVGAVRLIGAEPILATHANAFVGAASIDSLQLRAWQRFLPHVSPDVILAFDSAGSEMTRRVARDSSVALVDLEGLLQGGERDWFADYLHFTDAGASRVAAALAQAARAELCAGASPVASTQQ